MINLLPPEEKNRLFFEQRKKLAIILWFLFLGFLACLVLILLSINIYILGNLEAKKIAADKEEKLLEKPEIKELLEKITSVNLTLQKLNSGYKDKPKTTDIFEKISKTLPEGINLSSISMNLSGQDKYSGRVSVTGLASSRELLFDFKNNLEKETEFTEINFPASSWIKPKDINFTADFKLKIR